MPEQRPAGEPGRGGLLVLGLLFLTAVPAEGEPMATYLYTAAPGLLCLLVAALTE
jgi:hypothetical protein